MRTLVISESILGPRNSHLRSVLRAKVDSEGPALASFDEVEKRLSQVPADMVVVVVSPEEERGMEILRKVRPLTAAPLLAMGTAAEPKLILRALQEGADYYLDEADLENSLEAALARIQTRGDSSGSNVRVLGVMSASGGAGSSTLAVNLAVLLAREHQRCALIDLKPGRGDLAALLDVKPCFTLADLSLNINRLDQAMFEKTLVAHSSGVHLLAAPQMFGDMRIVTPQGVHQGLLWAGKLFQYVVVDLEDCFHEEQQVALRLLSTLLLVVRLDFTSLRNARRILDFLAELGLQQHQIKLVVNRFGQPSELPVEEAEQALGCKLAFFVPDDPRTINAANNMGMPAVLKSPNARISQSLVQLSRLALERRRNGNSSFFMSAMAKLFSR